MQQNNNDADKARKAGASPRCNAVESTGKSFALTNSRRIETYGTPDDVLEELLNGNMRFISGEYAPAPGLQAPAGHSRRAEANLRDTCQQTLLTR